MVIVSPTFPPEEMYEMLISVDTPVENRPFDATANDLHINFVFEGVECL